MKQSLSLSSTYFLCFLAGVFVQIPANTNTYYPFLPQKAEAYLILWPLPQSFLLFCFALFCFFQPNSISCVTFPINISSVQLLSCVQLFVTPWIVSCQASLSIINSWTLLKLMSIESVMPSNHLMLCCPLLLLPSIFPSIWVFSNESVLPINWPKYCSFTFSISLSNDYSRLISLGLTGLFSLQSKGFSRIFSNTTSKDINFSALSFLHSPTLTSIHDYWKNYSFD